MATESFRKKLFPCLYNLSPFFFFFSSLRLAVDHFCGEAFVYFFPVVQIYISLLYDELFTT